MADRDKFKVWDKSRLLFCWGMHLDDFYINPEGKLKHPNNDCSSFELVRCTGLEDCNGVLIYEGDIVYLAGYGNYETLYPFIELFEGLAENGQLHPMQAAFREHHGLQCGFCTPGMVMSAVDLVTRNPDPSEQEIREWLVGNICRCTGYHNIVKAIQAAAKAMRGGRRCLTLESVQP